LNTFEYLNSQKLEFWGHPSVKNLVIDYSWRHYDTTSASVSFDFMALYKFYSYFILTPVCDIRKENA